MPTPHVPAAHRLTALIPTDLGSTPGQATPAGGDAGIPREVLKPLPGWRWPLPGRPEVVRAFDPPDTPWGSGHRGVDLAAPPGTTVLAAGPGVVSYARILAGRGVIAIQHAGGLRTTYEPLVVTVAAGRRVAAGDVIGTLVAGHPGCPHIACLHWGLLRGNRYLDPLALIRTSPIRLLPLADDAPDPRLRSRPGAASASAAAAPISTTTTSPEPAGGWGRLRSASTAAALGLGIVGMLAAARRRPP